MIMLNNHGLALPALWGFRALTEALMETASGLALSLKGELRVVCLSSCCQYPRNLPCPRRSPKEGVKTENDHINLNVAGQDGSVVQFKIKRHTPLNKLMKAYCERQGLSMRQIRFRFDGQPINETDTPAQLEMEDEDTIDVFQQQTGRSWQSCCLCPLRVVPASAEE
ncbi:PREDICTED: small ubiquitin-related modifier 3-like [Odobenus rosmarus divergens]|uniref:Small ubiquitin-related modifier 3-like n=1 Tax=Odobenus rosmarus divergens TaxID=9708 RepID=A0A9B0G540_ODORO